MNSSGTNSIDYVVTQKKEGKYLIGQILIYILVFGVAFAVVGVFASFLGILGVVTGVVLACPIWLLMYNMTRTIVNFDRKYSIFTPNVTMDKTPHTVISFEIIKDRKKADPDKRDVVFECEIRNAEFFAPYNDEYKDKCTDSAVSRTVDFRSSVKKTEDVYFGVFPNDDGSKTVVIFEAVDKIVEKLAYYNKAATVVTKLTR